MDTAYFLSVGDYCSMNDNKFLLDLPENCDNDAIGYKVYVTNLIDAIKSNARMVGLLSNYGSGKSTVINMVKEKIKQDRFMKTKFKLISINLWKINNEKEQRNANSEDSTLNIHKFLLRSLIQYLPESANKEYFRKKIDNKYTLFNIVMKNKSDNYILCLLFAIFLFNIIMKLDIVGFSVPRVCNFILDLAFCICFIILLSRSKVYLSFNKETSNRTINENDTIDCFNEIINEIKSSEGYDNIVICIEDLDRYNDSETVIRVIEQIYKFYIENEKEKNVKFIISLKPPYTLVKDNYLSLTQDSIKKVLKEYKELYEKLFDVIINLQTISYQNYGSVLIKLLEQKKDLLQLIKLELPEREEEIGVWSYLYKGKNVTVRDIKHRYNYFLVVYENLYKHKQSLNNANLIEINVETCLFIAYLEDEYSDDFYHLLEDSQKFNNIVASYIFNKEIIISTTDNYSAEFISEISDALRKGIITIDYSMYFYKYPKGKPILNIFDSTIQNAIFSDHWQNIYNFDLYCEKAGNDTIIKSLKQKVKESGIPEIFFANKIIFHEANQLYSEDIRLFLSQSNVFSSENGVKTVKKRLIQLGQLYKAGEEKILEDYIDIIAKDLEENYNTDKIIEYRKEIIKTIGLISNLSPLYNDNLPLITVEEITPETSPSIVLSLINPNLIKDESIMKIIDIIATKDISFKSLVLFFDRISSIDKEIFKEIFYSFDYIKYSRNERYMIYKKDYKCLELNHFEELKRIAQKTRILPYKNEKYVINELNKMEKEDKKISEQLYIDIINIVGNISSLFKKYITNCTTYYTYNEKIEDELYESDLYKQYVYSKCNRSKHLSYEPSRFITLKESFLYYFINSKNLNDSYNIDIEVLNYIKQNVSYKDLSFFKIMLLLEVPQTYEDFLCVYNKKYKNPGNDSSELSRYLKSIKFIDNDSEEKIIIFLINEVKKKNLNLSMQTYKHIVKAINNISNIRKFQKIKKLCTT